MLPLSSLSKWPASFQIAAWESLKQPYLVILICKILDWIGMLQHESLIDILNWFLIPDLWPKFTKIRYSQSDNCLRITSTNIGLYNNYFITGTDPLSSLWFNLLVVSMVIAWQAPTCDNAHSWRLGRNLCGGWRTSSDDTTITCLQRAIIPPSQWCPDTAAVQLSKG